MSCQMEPTKCIDCPFSCDEVTYEGYKIGCKITQEEIIVEDCPYDDKDNIEKMSSIKRKQVLGG